MAKTVEFNAFKNYMLMIHRSVDSGFFRNLYAKVDGEEQDILRDGVLSCAYFVSSVLFHCRLIGDLRTTVRGLEADLRRSGWQKIEDPRVGSVLVWEPKVFPDGGVRKHVGFCIDSTTAISNSAVHRVPKAHPINAEPDVEHRTIESIYWHADLEAGSEK
ncbi:MAG: hypothetical protein O7E52_01750 [Candidatus Poribacteria bacterium]|nr:hypothetical protein [Candidatus Poribacteria bacterium]